MTKTTTNDATDRRTTNSVCDGSDLLETMQINKFERRHLSAGGAWVTGTMGGHQFEALVFPEHAVSENYEMGDSRVSKLHLRRTSDGVDVANFDRGWDIQPTTPIAAQIVDLLAAGLAETVYAL